MNATQLTCKKIDLYTILPIEYIKIDSPWNIYYYGQDNRIKYPEEIPDMINKLYVSNCNLSCIKNDPLYNQY